MAGLTSTGLVIKNVDEVLGDIESKQLADIDTELNVEADSVLGQINGIVAASIAELWELVELVYQSAYIDTASGNQLSHLAALTGAIREEATQGIALVTLTGDNGTTIPAGTRAYPPGDPDSMVETLADVTLSGTNPVSVNNVEARMINYGSEPYMPDGLTLVIDTPVNGLTFITSQIGDYTPGADEETDAELRQRRELLLAAGGTSTVDAMAADILLNAEGVDVCTVFENTGSVTDADGVPPKAVEVLVYSSTAPNYTNQAVADAIFDAKPVGTETHGDIGPITVTDESGNDHDVYFSEPTNLRCYIGFTLTAATDGTYIGADAVKLAIEQWALTFLSVGQSLYASDVVDFVANLEGVEWVDVTTVKVDDVVSKTTENLIATSRQLITVDDGDIVVTEA